MISKGNYAKFVRFVLLAISEEAKTWLHFFFVQCIIKQWLDSVFVISSRSRRQKFLSYNISQEYTPLCFWWRFTKNGFTGPKSLHGFRETCPWSGTLCCVLEQGTLLSQCLSPPRSINGYWWIVRETKKKLWGSDLPWTSIPSKGSRDTPCRFMLRQLRACLAPRLHLYLSQTI